MHTSQLVFLDGNGLTMQHTLQHQDLSGHQTDDPEEEIAYFRQSIDQSKFSTWWKSVSSRIELSETHWILRHTTGLEGLAPCLHLLNCQKWQGGRRWPRATERDRKAAWRADGADDGKVHISLSLFEGW